MKSVPLHFAVNIFCHCGSVIDFLANYYSILRIYHAISFKIKYNWTQLCQFCVSCVFAFFAFCFITFEPILLLSTSKGLSESQFVKDLYVVCKKITKMVVKLLFISCKFWWSVYNCWIHEKIFLNIFINILMKNWSTEM